MFQTGLVSISFRGESADNIIRHAAAAGLRLIEWGGDVHVRPGDKTEAKRVGAATRAAGLDVTAYGSYYRITGVPAGTVTVSDDFKRVCETARYLGTDVVRAWGGTKSPAQLDRDELARMAEEARLMAIYAGIHGLKLTLECHNFTVTEDYGSANAFLNAVGAGNLLMYWQPNQLRDTDYNLRAAAALAPRTVNIHVFNWTSHARLPLAGGAAVWHQYLERFAAVSGPIPGRPRGLLLEFMHDDRIETLAETAATLHSWLAGGNIKNTSYASNSDNSGADNNISNNSNNSNIITQSET